MNVVTKRAAQKEDKRRRVRDAAWELFRSQGFSATTTKAIAERAGVATGTLFLYASDKADLLFLVLADRLSAALETRLRTLDHDAPLLDQLLHVYGGFIDLYAAEPDIARHFVREYPGATGPNAQHVGALTLALYGHIARLVAVKQACGEVRPDAQPQLVAHNSFALYFAALHTWLSGFSSIEGVKTLLRSSLELAFEGICARDRAR